ncbi:unnamed protein product [Rhizophagus irregularis]|nr:unnamed protein product [Rhizophagus irregularis]
MSTRNFSAMLFFDQSEEWSLLNFIKYLDSIERRSKRYFSFLARGINLRRLKSDLGVGDNIENGGLTKSPYEDQRGIFLAEIIIR